MVVDGECRIGQDDGLDGEDSDAVFFNEEHDTPDEPPSYGSGGWTKDGKWALIYDMYDVWAVAPDASASRKLTERPRVETAIPRGAVGCAGSGRGARYRSGEAAVVARGECGDARHGILFAGVDGARRAAEAADGSEELSRAGQGERRRRRDDDGDYVSRSAGYSDHRFVLQGDEEGDGRESAAGADCCGARAS